MSKPLGVKEKEIDFQSTEQILPPSPPGVCMCVFVVLRFCVTWTFCSDLMMSNVVENWTQNMQLQFIETWVLASSRELYEVQIYTSTVCKAKWQMPDDLKIDTTGLFGKAENLSSEVYMSTISSAEKNKNKKLFDIIENWLLKYY